MLGLIATVYLVEGAKWINYQLEDKVGITQYIEGARCSFPLSDGKYTTKTNSDTNDAPETCLINNYSKRTPLKIPRTIQNGRTKQ